jgi:hypothetical protein
MMSPDLLWNRLEFGKLPDTLEIGTTVLSDRYEQGTEFTEQIFLRQHLEEKKEKFEGFLNSSQFNRMYINGPRGCGKTTFISILARMYAIKERKRVLVVNFRHGQECHVLQFNCDEVLLLSEPMESETLHNSVRTYLDRSDTPHFDLCIHDGVRQKIGSSTALMGLLNARIGPDSNFSKVVHVTSLAFHIKGGDQLPKSRSITQDDSFDSWVLADHVLAFQRMYTDRCLQDSLVNDIKALEALDDDDDDDGRDIIKAYVENRFYYAGGCARFMFNYTVEQLKEELSQLVEQMSETDWTAFKSSAIPSGTSDAVNSLMQRFTGSNRIGKCTAVSRYILMQAYEQCGSDMIKAVTIAAEQTSNPALKGWAFELQQLEVIKKVLNTELETTSVVSDKIFTFRPSYEAHYDGENLRWKHSQAGVTVIWCMLWNQGCFDVAIYFDDGTLVTIQFTIAKEHSLKLEYVTALRKALKDSNHAVNRAFHIGVRDEGDLKFKSPTGTGFVYNTFDFEVNVRASPKLVYTEGQKAPLHLVFPEGGTNHGIHMRNRKL